MGLERPDFYFFKCVTSWSLDLIHTVFYHTDSDVEAKNAIFKDIKSCIPLLHSRLATMQMNNWFLLEK